MNRSSKWLGTALLPVFAGLLACGGGGSSAPPAPAPPATAAALAYTDPASGTYLLKKNAALSTATHLVLDLVGPAGTGMGVAMGLTADTAKVAWTNVAATEAAGTFVQNGTQFQLGTGLQVLKAKVAGGAIQAVAAQKGTGSSVALNGALLRVALDLKTGQTPGAVTLTTNSILCQVIDGSGTLAPITVSVGSLSAQ